MCDDKIRNTETARCEICGIKTSRTNIMARFALNEERCKQWIKATGNKELAHMPTVKLHQLKYICRQHFRPNDFRLNGTRLRKTAVPSLNVIAKPLSDELLNDFPLHVLQDDETVTMEREGQPSNVTLTRMEDEMAVMVQEYDSEALHIFNLPQGHDYLPTPIPKKVVIKRSVNAPEPLSVTKYNCTSCPYVTTCKRIMDKHSKAHPPPVAAHNVKCPRCSFTTTKMQYLKVHSKLHFKEKPYKCIYCNTYTRTLSELADHYKCGHGIGKSKMVRAKAHAPDQRPCALVDFVL